MIERPAGHPAVLSDERAALMRRLAAEAAGCTSDRSTAFYWALVAGNHVAQALWELGIEPARYTRATAGELIASHGMATYDAWEAWATLMEARTLWERATVARAEPDSSRWESIEGIAGGYVRRDDG